MMSYYQEPTEMDLQSDETPELKMEEDTKKSE